MKRVDAEGDTIAISRFAQGQSVIQDSSAQPKPLYHGCKQQQQQINWDETTWQYYL